MSERSRVRINLAQAEIEVEGSESFVAGFRPQLDALLERLAAASAARETAAGAADVPPKPLPTAPTAPAKLALPPFGEYLHFLPPTATEVDRMLAAGFYLQQLATDDSFATGDANKRLAEHGIKIGNASQCVRQSLAARRVFAVTRGRFRVSQQGRAYLRQLTNGAISD